MHYPLADLKRDLESTEGVPPEVMQSFRRFRTRRTLEGAVVIAAEATSVAELITGYVLRDQTPEDQLPKGFWVAVGGLTVAAAIGIEVLVLPPRRLIATLNDWYFSE